MNRGVRAQARRIDARKRLMRVGLLAVALVGGLWWGSAQAFEPVPVVAVAT